MNKINFLRLLEESKISEAIEFAEGSRTDRELLLAAIGDYFLGLGDLENSWKFYAQSLSDKPNPAAHFGIGQVLLNKGALKDSVAFFLKSAQNDSHRIKSILKIGIAERLLGNIKASLSAYKLAQKSGYESHILDVNIATLLSDLGEYEEAGKYYSSAMSKAPGDDKVRFNCSLHMLSLGEFKEGLEQYESRPWCFRAAGKEWLGEPNKNVLVLAEQGYGDLVQFSRFIPEVKKISKGLALACDPNISRLISGLGVVDEFFGLEKESIDLASASYPEYCRVLSIPHLMSLDVRLNNGAYLKPDPERFEFWKGIVSSHEGLKVGFCWQGGKRNHSEMIFNDRKRSVDLKVLEPLLHVEGAKFFSLQKDWKEPHSRIIEIMDGCGDFMDTASLVANMDLVISVDTAIAHVAGALGKPVWMMARLGGCWRWGNFGSDTFWYPSMRIFRQETMDDWSGVVKEVKQSLADLIGSR